MVELCSADRTPSAWRQERPLPFPEAIPWEPIRMSEEVTVVCSAWHKQKNLDLYVRQHSRSLLEQTIPVKIIYVCDGGLVLDKPDPRVTVVTVSEGIKTAEAFNIGLALTNTPYTPVLA